MENSRFSNTLKVISGLLLLVATVQLLVNPSFEALAVFLSGTAAILSLFKLQTETPRSDTARFITKPREHKQVKIAVWGPTGSGKTTLLRAFGWSIHSKQQKAVDGFRYEIEELDSRGLDTGSDFPEPTEKFITRELRFKRIPIKKSRRYIMSSFLHDLITCDSRGSLFLQATQESVNYEEPETRATLMALLDADIILIALDPTLIKDENSEVRQQFYETAYSSYENFNETEPDNDTRDSNRLLVTQRYFSQKSYATLVSSLISILEKSNSERKRYYAVCVVKSDLIGDFARYLDPDALIEALFGKIMTNALTIPAPEYMNTFTVSAVGYDDSFKPNFNPSTGWLLDVDKWQPYGVEFPFFWAFEAIEKNLLYEQFSKNIFQRLVRSWRLSRYVPYPKVTLSEAKSE